MSAGHTPGPWAVCVTPPNPQWYAGLTIGATDPRNPRRVCDLTPLASDEINAANGALIAAAPELLAALQGFLDMYIAAANSGDWGNWDPEEDDEVIAARAAILKATGDAK